MSVKAGAFALVAGLATFLGLGITVAGLTDHWIDFPMLLGLLAGSIAGLAVSASVSVALTDDVPADRQRLAGTVAGFGGGFVVGLVGSARIDVIGSVGSIGVAFVVAVLAAVGVYKLVPFGTTGTRAADGTESETGE